MHVALGIFSTHSAPAADLLDQLRTRPGFITGYGMRGYAFTLWDSAAEAGALAEVAARLGLELERVAIRELETVAYS